MPDIENGQLARQEIQNRESLNVVENQTPDFDTEEARKEAQVQEAKNEIARLTADLASKDEYLFQLMNEIDDPNLDDGARDILKRAHQTALEKFGEETLRLVQQKEGKERLIQLLSRTADQQIENLAEKTEVTARLNQGTKKFDVGDLQKELAQPQQEPAPPLYDGSFVELPEELPENAITPIEASADTQAVASAEDDEPAPVAKKSTDNKRALHIFTTAQGQVNAQHRAERGKQQVIDDRAARQEKLRKQREAYQQSLRDAKTKKGKEKKGLAA